MNFKLPESLVVKYNGTMLKMSHVHGMGAIPEFIRFTGQDFGEEFKDITKTLRIGMVLLLTAGHRTKALKDLHEEIGKSK